MGDEWVYVYYYICCLFMCCNVEGLNEDEFTMFGSEGM